MNIYTSYFANWRNFPKDAICISIARVPCPGFSGFDFSLLAPTKSILDEYKRTHDKERYTLRYTTEVLQELTPEDVYKIFVQAAYDIGMNSIVLLCYEKPDKFCHRHLVAEWLSPLVKVTELGSDIDG